MKIKDVVSTLEGKRVVGNAATGASIGLHSSTQTRSFWTQATGPTGLTKAAWEAEIRAGREPLSSKALDLRFGVPRDAEGRYGINTTTIPLAMYSKAGGSFYTKYAHCVVSLATLHYLISALDKNKPAFSSIPDIDRSSSEKELENYAKSIKSIPKKYRIFDLGRSYGKSVWWFTSDAAIEKIEREFRYCRGSFKGTKADWYSTYLGLGHHKAGTWLAIIHVPIEVADVAGHYRPAFCDGASFPWFMAGCCDPAKRLPTSGWGQTANLYSLTKSQPIFDGASERVSREIFPKDFQIGSRKLKVRFDLLGKISRDWGTKSAEQSLAEKIWRDRGR